MNELLDKVHVCIRCEISSLCQNKVVWHTNDLTARPKLAFIGEAPGRTEYLFGEPFIGRSGQLLHKIINDAGASSLALFFSNSILCTPFFDDDLDEIRTPTKEEISACSSHLKDQLYLWQPDITFALGKVAQKALAFNKDVVPLMHPSAILRQSNPNLDHKKTVLKIQLAISKWEEQNEQWKSLLSS